MIQYGRHLDIVVSKKKPGDCLDLFVINDTFIHIDVK